MTCRRILVVDDSPTTRGFVRDALEAMWPQASSPEPGAAMRPQASSPEPGAAMRPQASSPEPGDTGAAAGPCEVVEAGSGFDALRLLPRDAWDLVITDINMPDINGLELVAFIRRSERHRATPILIVSTQSAERDRARGLALGADAWLEKPFTVAALGEAVERLLAGRSRRSAPPPQPAPGGAGTRSGETP